MMALVEIDKLDIEKTTAQSDLINTPERAIDNACFEH